MSRASWFVILLLVDAPLLRAQATLAEELSPPAQPPVVVAAPSLFPAPVFVPADVLLCQADQIQPLTEEGWIITTRAPRAFAHAGDPATRLEENFEIPMRLREYDTQIRLAQAELENIRERLIVYHYFNKAGALMIDVQNARLALLSTEERLRNLRYERMLFQRHRSIERALHTSAILTAVEPVAHELQPPQP
jgi:hypothetical protein